MKLGVNIDHVATLREARREEYPNPLDIALLAEKAGADGITMHLREDRRHIKEKDVIEVKNNIKTKLNLEMSLSSSIVDFAYDIAPCDVCIVPENRQELTTEGGLDVLSQKEKIKKVIEKLKSKNICISLFIEPILNQVEMAKFLGADVVELHTGRYANNYYDAIQKKEELENIKKAVSFANNIGLLVNAGHGLNYKNISEIAMLHGINELNIGHSIISYSIYVGIEKAVIEMKRLIN